MDFFFGNKTGHIELLDKILSVQESYPVPDFIEKNVAVDIGANLGAFSIIYHKLFNIIYGFEASYENHVKALEYLASDKIENSIIFNMAAYSETGRIIKIHQHHSKDCGSNSILQHEDFIPEIYHNTITINLPDIFKLIEAERINYLKVDCEGAEFDLLMNQDLRNIDCISMEVHFQFPEKANTLMEYLKRYFFATRYKDKRPDAHVELTLLNTDRFKHLLRK